MIQIEKLYNDEEIKRGDIITLEQGCAIRSVLDENHNYNQRVLGVCVDINDNSLLVEDYGVIGTNYIGKKMTSNVPVTISTEPGKVRAITDVPDKYKQGLQIFGYVVSVINKEQVAVRLKVR